MVHLIADDTPLSILTSLVEPVVIYDPTGTRVIGTFTPVDLERGRRLYAELAARIDADQGAGQTVANGPLRPFAEMVKRLQEADANGELKMEAPPSANGPVG